MLLTELKRRRRRFRDAEFPASRESLVKDNNEEKLVDIVKGWKRLFTLTEENLKIFVGKTDGEGAHVNEEGVLLDMKTDPDDVFQGQLGEPCSLAVFHFMTGDFDVMA